MSRSTPTSGVGSLHVVMVSLHTSPLASPGAADAGGMNVVELNSACALAARGHRVDLVTRRDDPSLPSTVEYGCGVRVFHLDAGPPEPIAKSGQEFLIEPFRAALSDWLVDRAADVDLVHSHHWFSGVAALPVARAFGLPHVQSYHSVAAPVGADLDAGEQPESAGRPPGERSAAQQSDAIIAVSDWEKATIIDRYAPEPAKVFVVRPGVDLDQFRPLRSDEPPTPPPGYLLFAARLQPLKAPDLAVRLLAEIPVDGRPRLAIAGETSADFGWYRAELTELVASLGLDDQVVYLGSQDRDQLAARMRGALLLVNPSRSETYGLINLEAAASGIPVVASRSGGMVESVVDEQTGVLLASREPADWADEVRRFVDDPALRARFGAAGREFAESRGWAQVAAELEVVYGHVVSR